MKPVTMLIAAAASATIFALPAQATTCALSDFTPAATACAGYVDGPTIFNNNSGNVATVTSMLTSLGFVNAGSINFASLYANGSPLKLSNLTGATHLSWSGAPTLSGTIFVGMHWGGHGGDENAIYKLMLQSPVTSLTVKAENPGGTSDAVLFLAPASVPEPATWAMMIAGFGLAGAAYRRRSTKVAFAA